MPMKSGRRRVAMIEVVVRRVAVVNVIIEVAEEKETHEAASTQ
jgi:hypothetical protein